MELDKNLINLQGTLYSFCMQDLLNKSDTLHQVLEGIKEVTENVTDVARSKLTFLLVLYTKLSVSEKLRHDNFVGQYINAEPYFEKEYLIIYIYHLRLQQELFRIIDNCPGSLGIELLEIIIEKLKEPDFCQTEFGVEHFYQFLQSIFVKLCKLETKFHVECSTEKFALSFLNVYDIVEKVIVTSMGYDAELYGMHLYYFFRTLLYCIKLQKNPNVSDDPIYQLSFETNCSKECICQNDMTNCLEKVFQKIPNILEGLTIDMWMSFSECYCSSDPKNSIQFLIGDLIFNVIKEVKEEKLFNVPSNVLEFLSSIAINKSELIAQAGIDEIISNIRNGEKEWFKALVRHSAFKTNESVECLIGHLELADSDDLNLILNNSYDCLNCVEKDHMNLMKKLFLAALRKTPDYEHWLVRIFNKYEPNLLTTAETHEELIETFNKISKGKHIPHSDLVLLCVQSPLETIRKICHIVICSSEQMQFAIEILKILKHPCNVMHFEDFTLLEYVLLKFVMEDLTDKEKQTFINLIVQLGKENILKTSFHNNLLKCLKGYLESEQLEKAVLCLELERVILELKIFDLHKAAFLVFISQVLEHFSWGLRSFSIIKADGRELVDDITSLIINDLEMNENGSHIQWAQQEILKSSEVNQAYFCDLWFKFHTNWPCSGAFHTLILALAHSHHKSEELRNVLINFEEPFEVRLSIIISLTMLLPVLTYQKWDSIFRQLVLAWRDINSEKREVYYVLDVFGSSIQMLSMNLKHEEMYPCFKYCLRNYGKLAKQHCRELDEECVVWTFEKIFLFLGEIEDGEEKKSCWEIFPSLLMELVDGLKKRNATDSHRKGIEGLLRLLDLKDVAEGLMKKLH